MKVLQTIAGFGLKSGGPTTCTYNLISAINEIEQSLNVEILTPDPNSSDDRLVGLGEDWIKHVKNDTFTPLDFSNNINRFLNEKDYDIYHTNGLWKYINHKTCDVAREKSKPYIITTHGMLYRTALNRSSWKKSILRKIWFDHDIMDASCIHATCDQEMVEIREYGYLGPIAVIGNPVEIPEYTHSLIVNHSYHRNRTTIGFLGRIHPIKRIENILEALNLLRNENVEFCIIGSGDASYERTIHSLVVQYNLEKNVHFFGFLNGKEKFETLAKLDCLFVPSDMENFGMIVPEALIVGTPVMASLGTPWTKLNDEHCGWWCDNSPETIAKIIAEVGDASADKLAQMGHNGREYIIRKFSAVEVAKQMLELYRWINGEVSQPSFVYTI
ncbi:glycosyltransferase [Bacteroides caecimuris]|uniref:glycosyltransferase n=1 Tax=Bacteroides caecimuris TaxID=1796613 RepID=UPI00265F5EFB|nr:glycosyltransferase [Bacteroides caecimuris]